MHDGQLQIHSVLRNLPKTVRNRLMECCRGYGKTTLNVLMACEDCARPHPLNYPVRIIGPEKDQTVEIVAQIFDIIGKEAPPGWITRKNSTWKVGNNRIIVSGFNRGSIERLRGKRAANIYLEEIRDVPSEAFEYGMKSVILPMSLAVKCPVTAATTSASQILHSMNTYFKPIAVKDGGYFNFTIYDCPLYGPEEIKQAIQDCGGEDTEDFIREYLVQAVDTKVQRAIPAFDASKHVEAFETPLRRNTWVITDVGGLRDPTHVVAMMFDHESGRVFIRDEIQFPPQTATSRMVEALREFEDRHGLESESEMKPSYMDAPGQFFVDLREEYLFFARPVQKGGFEETVKSLNQGFYDGMIVVHPDCKQLIYQLSTAKLNKAHTDFERDVGVAGHLANHADGVAAAMYGWRMRDTRKPSEMPIFEDTQWVHPKVIEGARRHYEGNALHSIRPRMRRF